MSTRRSFCHVLIASLLSAGLASADAEGGDFNLPTGFSQHPIATGVANPNSFAFLPDGRVLVTEQKKDPPLNHQGFVYLLVGTTVRGPILTIPNVETNGVERGLQGIAVDPGWPGSPYVYVHFTSINATHTVRRYTATGDLDAGGSLDLALGEPYDILVDLPGQHQFHNGGTLRFGPDDMLYVSQGDDATDECTDLQDPSIWKGVILRLDVSQLPAGSGGPPAKADLVPTGNPWSGPDDNARLTYAVGLRNPFRFTIDPVTGNLYIGDVGESSWEELDECVGGENFGWPGSEGANEFPPGKGCGAHGQDPIAEYAHTANPNAIIAGPRYRNTGGIYTFGAEYEGDVFYIAFYEGWLRRLTFDGASWDFALPVPGQPTATEWASGLAFVSDLQVGPDGALYYLRRSAPDFFGRIVRDPVTVSTETPAPVPDTRLTLSPRPLSLSRTLELSFTLTGAQGVRASLFDVGGRHVRQLVDGRRPAGRHTVSWDPDVEPGIYFVKLETATSTETVRLPILP